MDWLAAAAAFSNVFFNGLAYGILLFLMAGGLSITMGMMGFANLAHGSLAMLGGYITVTLMQSAGWSFLMTLPAATLITAAVGAILERVLFRRLYGAAELDQILLTLGVVLISIAGASYVWGLQPVAIVMPDYLSGHVFVGFLELQSYRLFIVAIGAALTLAMILGIDNTNFGAKVRASVDNRRMTMSCGVDVNRLFTLAFALGSGIGGLGGALSINLVGLDPSFPIKFLVFLLVVVVVGGKGSTKGALVAAMTIGVFDVAGKYYFPEAGAFFIYALVIALLIWRPHGLLGVRGR